MIDYRYAVPVDVDLIAKLRFASWRCAAGQTRSPPLLAFGGAGLARLALFHIGPDIEAGRLVPVLEDFNPGDCEDVHAVYLGQGGLLPARVRAFMDFLGDHIRIDSVRLARSPGKMESGCSQRTRLVAGRLMIATNFACYSSRIAVSRLTHMASHSKPWQSLGCRHGSCPPKAKLTRSNRVGRPRRDSNAYLIDR